MHREVLARVLDVDDLDEGLEVDHINGDGLDNRRINLRLATRKQNKQRKRRLRAKKSSRFKGVVWAKRRASWEAYIGCDGKTRYLGSFKNDEDAARAYDEAALKHFGKWAVTNAMLGLLDSEVS